MPIWDQASPLAAALGVASNFMQGQQERKVANQEMSMKAAQAQSEAAYKNALAQQALDHGDYFSQWGAQRTALTPSMVQKNVAGAAMQDAHGNLYDAQGNYLAGPQTGYEIAKTGLTNAQTGQTTANTGLINAKTQVQLQGELPFLKSKTAYTNSLPGYNASKIQALEDGIGARSYAAAQATGARLQVAGMDNQSRIVLGSMVNDRIAAGQTEAEAMRGSLAQYNDQLQSYDTAIRANAMLASHGKPTNALPPVPQYQDPRLSQGGVQTTNPNPSASIRIQIDPTTGRPNTVYSPPPRQQVNVQGEAAQVKAAISAGHGAYAQGALMSRTDIDFPTKNAIWAAANVHQPAPPAASPSGFQVPLMGGGAAPSVGGSAFGLPQQQFSIPGMTQPTPAH